MSENTAEVAENAPLVFPNPTAEATFNQLKEFINERNAEVGKINAVKGDRVSLTEQVAEQSTNPDIVAAREARDAAQAALDDAVMALHAVVTPEVDSLLSDAEGSVKESEEKVKEFDSTIKPGVNFFKKAYGEELAKHLPSLSRLSGFNTRGAGASGRRIRGFSFHTVIDGEETGYDNLAGVAKALGLETADLQSKFFEAAGVEDLKKAPDTVEFNVDFTEVYEDDSTEIKAARVVGTRDVKDD